VDDGFCLDDGLFAELGGGGFWYCNSMRLRLLVGLLLCLPGFLFFSSGVNSQSLPVASASGATAAPLALSGDLWRVHDPAIVREGNRYYVFATGRAPMGGQLPIRCSANLTDWKICGQVFDAVPEWIHAASPKTRDLWAPDVSYFAGRFHLYYAYSTFGSKVSGIGLVTNETLDSSKPNYRWRDEGLVMQSTSEDDFNAIDPNVVFDEQGQPWMSFGSFWSGIKLRKIDTATGKPSTADKKIYALATRTSGTSAIEAPFIVHHGDYFYLFVSFDICCRGAESTYHTMVGRSRSVTGPYLDQSGKPMLKGGGTELLHGNQQWAGPGGASILQRPEGDVIAFHAYDMRTGRPALQISPLVWQDGWPQAMLSAVPLP